MSLQENESDDLDKIDRIKIYKKVRKNWGGLNPSTKIKTKKRYNRNKENKQWRMDIDESV